MSRSHRPVLATGLVALSLLAAACGGQRSDAPPPVCVQPTQLTSARAEPRDKEKEKLRAEVNRLERERDAARQWATDEGRRQAEGQRLRQYRRDLQAQEWTKLDALDDEIREVRHRLDMWTLRGRKEAFQALAETEEQRAKIDGEIRRIHSEPEDLLPQLRERLDADLERSTARLHAMLAAPPISNGPKATIERP